MSLKYGWARLSQASTHLGGALTPALSRTGGANAPVDDPNNGTSSVGTSRCWDHPDHPDVKCWWMILMSLFFSKCEDCWHIVPNPNASTSEH